mmetsp:Transcript_122252/g.280023  ORF Transcript_122252/g.280023 Transcript_122252/m.280023 type:complete len:405 (-) Transcript_122252:135-1349(-)
MVLRLPSLLHHSRLLLGLLSAVVLELLVDLGLGEGPLLFCDSELLRSLQGSLLGEETSLRLTLLPLAPRYKVLLLPLGLRPPLRHQLGLRPLRGLLALGYQRSLQLFLGRPPVSDQLLVSGLLLRPELLRLLDERLRVPALPASGWDGAAPRGRWRPPAAGPGGIVRVVGGAALGEKLGGGPIQLGVPGGTGVCPGLLEVSSGPGTARPSLVQVGRRHQLRLSRIVVLCRSAAGQLAPKLTELLSRLLQLAPKILFPTPPRRSSQQLLLTRFSPESGVAVAESGVVTGAVGAAGASLHQVQAAISSTPSRIADATPGLALSAPRAATACVLGVLARFQFIAVLNERRRPQAPKIKITAGSRPPSVALAHGLLAHTVPGAPGPAPNVTPQCCGRGRKENRQVYHL